MSWNEADREKYAVVRDRYSSDMSDAEFVLIAPLLPAAKARGRKRTDPRIILNALFYLIRAGCPWRLLPKDFPPFTTVQNQFYAWRDSGVWTQILAILVMAAREVEGRQAAPTAIVVDSQSVKTTEAGGPRGFDAAKKVKGRKRQIAVDTIGLPITCQITTADVQDRDALEPVLKDVHRKSPFVTMAFVDSGYQGDEAQRAAFEASRIAITVVKRTDKPWARIHPHQSCKQDHIRVLDIVDDAGYLDRVPSQFLAILGMRGYYRAKFPHRIGGLGRVQLHGNTRSHRSKKPLSTVL